MLGVKAQKGIRMKNLGDGEPWSRKTLEELPRVPAPLTAASNRSQPALAYLVPKVSKTGKIAGNGMIVKVALHHAS